MSYKSRYNQNCKRICSKDTKLIMMCLHALKILKGSTTQKLIKFIKCHKDVGIHHQPRQAPKERISVNGKHIINL